MGPAFSDTWLTMRTDPLMVSFNIVNFPAVSREEIAALLRNVVQWCLALYTSNGHAPSRNAIEAQATFRTHSLFTIDPGKTASPATAKPPRSHTNMALSH